MRLDRLHLALALRRVTELEKLPLTVRCVMLSTRWNGLAQELGVWAPHLLFPEAPAHVRP
eukprot:685499-Pyramimonas_sp.AAC.1